MTSESIEANDAVEDWKTTGWACDGSTSRKSVLLLHCGVRVHTTVSTAKSYTSGLVVLGSHGREVVAIIDRGQCVRRFCLLCACCAEVSF